MKDSPFHKPAPTSLAITDLIRDRWSPRSFSNKQITKDEQHQLFEAARWSASCFNDQPWYFIVAERSNKAEFAKMLDCLMESNQSWAQHASMLMMSVVRVNFSHNGNPNKHAWHDMGIAIADLTVQATALNIGIHQMAGFKADQAMTNFGIPEGHEPVVISALGFADVPDKLPDDLADRERAERVRKPLSEFVYQGVWGQPKFENE